jgi:KDO2-lipid IV(A) lauroyltransferase
VSGPRVRPAHRIEDALVGALFAVLRSRDHRGAVAMGERLGDLARQLGIRRGVAAVQLAGAFPDKSAAEREAILRAHYRELGRVVAEYGRLGSLARSPLGEVVAAVHGIEHLDAARAAGRGLILLSGHFSNVELLGAWLARYHPVDFVVRPLSNPAVEARIARERAAAGVGAISADDGMRRAYEALRANRWVAMLADQDARRHGVFVPFLGRAASTATGPARFALATGAPIVMGFVTRCADRRLELHIEPPLVRPDADDPDPVRTLTARHVERLEVWVRRDPAMWFWLHRRWKTAPPS